MGVVKVVDLHDNADTLDECIGQNSGRVVRSGK